jgi:hypothetical protein
MTEASHQREPANSSLRRNWEIIHQHRFQLAEQLDLQARNFPRSMSDSFSRVARWLRGPARYEEALAQPLVLAFCTPVIKLWTQNSVVSETAPFVSAITDGTRQDSATHTGLGDQDGISSSEYSPEASDFPRDDRFHNAVQAGMYRIAGQISSRPATLTRLLVYPFILAVFAWSTWIFAGAFVLPSIAKLYSEFGLNLPALTTFLLRTTMMIERWWLAMLLVPPAYGLVLWWLNRNHGRGSIDGASWVDQKLMSKRGSLANWIWHLVLLLEWGLSSKTAVMIAGTCCHRGWLERKSLEWIGESISDRSHDRATRLQQPGKFLSQSRFQLISDALELPDSNKKVLVLREIGTYYRERALHWNDLLVRWISILLTWFCLGFYILVVTAIFSPIIMLLSGLTGIF